jgi:hypothetical protein
MDTNVNQNLGIAAASASGSAGAVQAAIGLSTLSVNVPGQTALMSLHL